MILSRHERPRVLSPVAMMRQSGTDGSSWGQRIGSGRDRTFTLRAIEVVLDMAGAGNKKYAMIGVPIAPLFA